MSRRPFVSVIIPSYNNGGFLRECLASFGDQNYPNYEVLLVDNGSTDATAQLCAEFPEVRYLFFDRFKSSYAARNWGARHARGEVLVFFDADQTARANFLSLLLEEYVPDDPDHVYVARLEDDPRVPRVLREFFPWLPSPEEQLAGRIQTAAVAVPRALFDALGGFKEHLLSGGDFEFFRRAVVTAQVHQNREVGAYHYYTQSVGHYLRKQERGVFGQCLLAEAEGRPGPSALSLLAEAAIGCSKRAADAMLIPLRYPESEWPIRWQAQMIRCLKLVYRLKAVVKYKLGAVRAGDLPADAHVSQSRSQTFQPADIGGRLKTTGARVPH